MSQVRPNIVNILAVVFYVLSLNAYILLIVATVKTMKKAKIFLIIFITMAIILAILGVATLVINIRDEFSFGDALDQGNNILVWIILDMFEWMVCLVNRGGRWGNQRG